MGIFKNKILMSTVLSPWYCEIESTQFWHVRNVIVYLKCIEMISKIPNKNKRNKNWNLQFNPSFCVVLHLCRKSMTSKVDLCTIILTCEITLFMADVHDGN